MPRKAAPRVFWEVDEEEGADDAQSSSDEEEENEQREQVQMDEDEDEAPVSETLDQPEPQHAKQQGKSLKLGAKLGAQAGKNELVCKVCGMRGHAAGFVGAVYQDCIMKPCFLCRQPGHTTMTCPHRVAPGVIGQRPPGAQAQGHSLLNLMRNREVSGVLPTRSLHMGAPKYQVDAAILRLHTRRVCCLEFHPTKDHLVMSGDKKGLIALWDMAKVNEKTHYRGVHKYLVNSIKFLPWSDGSTTATSSCDGTIQVMDVETSQSTELINLNPAGYTTEREWRMTFSVDAPKTGDLHVLVTGDNDGRVHVLDPRIKGPVSTLQLHKKANKVVSVALNPLEPRLVLTAGNDHTAKISDLRKMTTGGSAGHTSQTSGHTLAGSGPRSSAAVTAAAAAAVEQEEGKDSADAAGPSSLPSSLPASTDAAQQNGSAGGAAGKGRRAKANGTAASKDTAAGSGGAAGAAGKGGGKGGGGGGRGRQVGPHPAELLSIPHPRVVNSAVWSPLTGRTIMTTCQDNRIRAFFNLAALKGDASDLESRCTTIVHSHDFNRHLTPFRAEFDAKDLCEARIVIGRYISDDYGGVPLHPVDILDIRTGALLAALVDHNLTTISPVNKPHPRQDIIVSGSSRSLYKWAPVGDDDEEEGVAAKAGPSGAAAMEEDAEEQQRAALRDLVRRATAPNYRFHDADPDSGGKGKGAGGKGGGGGKGKKRPHDDSDSD